MERYFCIFSELGTIRKDFKFNTPEDYFTFILANKNAIVWSKLIDMSTGETIDEYQNLNSIDFSQTKINIPDFLLGKVDSLLLINQQQIIWLTKFAQKETPKAYKALISDPIRAYNIPAKSSYYDETPIPAGLAMIDTKQFKEIIDSVMDECTTSYKKRLFKLMVKRKGYEIIIKTTPLLESK